MSALRHHARGHRGRLAENSSLELGMFAMTRIFITVKVSLRFALLLERLSKMRLFGCIGHGDGRRRSQDLLLANEYLCLQVQWTSPSV